MSADPSLGKRVGAGARFSIFLRVALGGVLAVTALLLVNWLVGRPGVRQRFDLTATDRASLDPATTAVLRSLREPVTIDIFWRSLGEPLTGLGLEVHARTENVLRLMEAEAAGRVRLIENDLEDTAAIEVKKQLLRIRGLESCLVVSQGQAREVVRELGDIAKYDLGNPDRNAYKPPFIASFEAEAAVLRAILAVTRGESRRVYFTRGHGELDPFGEPGDISLWSLGQALQADGFEVSRWSPIEEPALPEDAAVVAIVGPTDPLSPELIDSLVEYHGRGGRILLAPDPNDEKMLRSELVELAERFGIQLGTGHVLQHHVDPTTGRVVFGPPTQIFNISPAAMKAHPIMVPSRDFGRSFRVFASHPVRVARIPDGGLSTALFSSGPGAWLNVDDNFEPDPPGESVGAFDLAVAGQISILGPVEDGDDPAEPPQDREGRVVVLGSSGMLFDALAASNADVNLAIFNWLADREWRVSIAPKDPDKRVLTPEHAASVGMFALAYLPGAMLAIGTIILILRRRGAPH